MANTRVYIGVSANIDIEINKIGTLFGEKESNSSVSCTAGCCIIARQHTGDENGKTTYKQGLLTAIGLKDFLKYDVDLGEPIPSETQKESNSNFDFSDSRVIVGRNHKGNENGNTYYTTCKITVKKRGIKTEEIPLKVETISVTNKESDGSWVQAIEEYNGKTFYLPMVGRVHKGDENANTTTTFAKYYFEIDEDGNIISN